MNCDSDFVSVKESKHEHWSCTGLYWTISLAKIKFGIIVHSTGMEAVAELSDSKGPIARAQDNCDRLIELMKKSNCRAGYIRFVEGCIHVIGCNPPELVNAPGYPVLLLVGANPNEKKRETVAQLVHEELKSLLQKPIEWVKDTLPSEYVLTFKTDELTIYVRWRIKNWFALIGDGPERSHLFA